MPEQQFQEKSPLTPMRQDATAVPSAKQRTGSDDHVDAGGGIIRTVSMVGAFAVESPFASARNPLEGGRNGPDDDRSDCEQHDRFSDACSLEYVEENTEGLAVAIPIVEEESNVFSLAVAHDPDGKPPRSRKSRWLPYALLASYILILIAVGAVILIVQGDENDTSHNSPSYYREQGIKERVQNIVGAEELQNYYSPYYKALQWITYQDPMQAATNSSALLQRYFMAYFYYATTVERPWDSCNPPVAQTGQDFTCIWNDLNYISRGGGLNFVLKPSIRWLSEKSECEWMGVRCDNLQQVRSVDLNGLNMSGTFPEGVQYLPFIQSLAMGYGTLKGTLPPMIGSMKHLMNFEIQNNALTGSLPAELWTSPNIQSINVASNKLTGSVPSDIQNLQDLRRLFLFGNSLAGTMPNEIGLLKSLASIDWQRNMFTGTLPRSLGNLKHISFIWVYENLFTGTIPPEWALAIGVSDIRIQNNAGLSGSIPEELYETGANRLDLYNCNFTGTISDKIGDMKILSIFKVANNHLTGTIPTDLSKLTDLTTFSVAGNDITGTMPASVCSLRKDSLLVVEADCLASTNGGAPQVSCENQCCTTCCDPKGMRCVES